jgi:glutamine synthetase adenylyltransferase
MNPPPEPAARLRQLIESAPDPDAARHYLASLKQESPEGYERIVNSPAAMRCAVAVFAYSRFLSVSVVREPERLLQVANSGTF